MLTHQHIELLQHQLPNLDAVYLFGSRARGAARADSDLDVAVLADTPYAMKTLWDVGAKLANEVHCDVDLLDMRSASTVMQHQILATGKRFWVRPSKQPQVDAFERLTFRKKWDLDIMRAKQLEHVKETGQIYGR